jgi:hypothetical protein
MSGRGLPSANKEGHNLSFDMPARSSALGSALKDHGVSFDGPRNGGAISPYGSGFHHSGGRLDLFERLKSAQGQQNVTNLLAHRTHHKDLTNKINQFMMRDSEGGNGALAGGPSLFGEREMKNSSRCK